LTTNLTNGTNEGLAVTNQAVDRVFGALPHPNLRPWFVGFVRFVATLQ
jgi:hypothetical protein